MEKIKRLKESVAALDPHSITVEFYADFNTMALMRWAREYRKERGMYISKLP